MAPRNGFKQFRCACVACNTRWNRHGASLLSGLAFNLKLLRCTSVFLNETFKNRHESKLPNASGVSSGQHDKLHPGL